MGLEKPKPLPRGAGGEGSTKGTTPVKSNDKSLTGGLTSVKSQKPHPSKGK